jgi:hypothetical protein
MPYRHKTKSGRILNFKNKDSFLSWRKGMFNFNKGIVRRKKGRGKISKKTRQAILDQERQLFIPIKPRKLSAQGQIQSGSIVGSIETTKGKMKKRARTHEIFIDDEDIGIIDVREIEESSRYTPTNVRNVIDHKQGGKIDITQLTGKGKKTRIVSKTRISIIPGMKITLRQLNLENKFKSWKANRTNPDFKLDQSELRELLKARGHKPLSTNQRMENKLLKLGA